MHTGPNVNANTLYINKRDNSELIKQDLGGRKSNLKLIVLSKVF